MSSSLGSVSSAPPRSAGRTAHSTLGRDAERWGKALGGGDAALSALDAVAEVNQAEVELSLLRKLQLVERFEVSAVVGFDRDRNVNPVHRALDAVGERRHQLHDATRVFGLPHVHVAKVAEAEVVSELDVGGNGIRDADQVYRDHLPVDAGRHRHPALEHQNLEAHVPLDRQPVVGSASANSSTSTSIAWV